MTLRYKLGLTGTKLGCDRAECGACTVLIDDVPHYSCSVLTHTVRSRAVISVEGLENPMTGELHPMHAASSRSRASSVRSACRDSSCRQWASSRSIPPPHGRSWRTASPAICVCQDYDKILTALMKGAEHAGSVQCLTTSWSGPTTFRRITSPR